MKIIAVIPARLDSTRFPGKLMQDLGGIPIITRTYQNVVATSLFDEVFVATDSPVIFDEIVHAGGSAVMTGQHETGSDRIAEAVKNLDCHVVINVQGDEPFLKRKPLEQLIGVFNEDLRHEVSLASLKIRMTDLNEIQNPNNVKVITDNGGFALYFSRSVIPYPRDQSLKVDYYKHIGVYAFRKEALMRFTLLKQSPLELSEKIECIRYLEHGMKIKMVETDFLGVGIDTEEDLEAARKLLHGN